MALADRWGGDIDKVLNMPTTEFQAWVAFIAEENEKAKLIRQGLRPG